MTKNLLIRIWVVCALGLFVDGFDLYVTSVAEPLFKKSFLLSPLWLGIAQAAAPIGAAVGAILIGYITDRVGRKTMLVFNFILFVVAVVKRLVIVSPARSEAVTCPGDSRARIAFCSGVADASMRS